MEWEVYGKSQLLRCKRRTELSKRKSTPLQDPEEGKRSTRTSTYQDKAASGLTVFAMQERVLKIFVSFGSDDRLFHSFSGQHAAWRYFSSLNLIIPYLWCLPTRTVDTTLCLLRWSASILWLSGLLSRPFHWSSFYKICILRYAWWLHHLTPRCTPEQSCIEQCQSRRSWLRYREKHYRTSSKGLAVLPESLTRMPLPLLRPREPAWACCTQSPEHNALPSSKRRISL